MAAADVASGLAELQRQQDLISTCTSLYNDLSAHFTALDRRIDDRSAALRRRNHLLDLHVRRTLDSLRRRDRSIHSSVDAAISNLHNKSSLPVADNHSLTTRLNYLCSVMDSATFFELIISKRKETDVLRSALPTALAKCVDPPTFVLDAINDVFPVDKREVKGAGELGWACVLVLESLVPAVEDPEMGVERVLVPRKVKERVRAMVEQWKEAGGGEDARPADVHAFLQCLVTFGVVEKGDRELYKKLVLSIAWRKQMPRIAVLLGLGDMMMDMIEELIVKGQQLDAINFAYEAGLEEKFPPVPLLKSFLEDAKKATTSNLEDYNNSGLSLFNASRKEQSAIRAAMKCIEDHKLEADFPLEESQKRLEHLEKAKAEKKKSPSPVGPASKRTRTNACALSPPAKAGRLTNNAYVSSFPAPVITAFARSPSSYPTYAPATPLYPYDRATGHGAYGSRSPPAPRDHYAYATEVAPPAVLGSPYSPAPMNYPTYGGYNNGMGCYSNGLSPVYQPAYYR